MVLGSIPRSETLPPSLLNLCSAFDDCSVWDCWKQQVKGGFKRTAGPVPSSAVPRKEQGSSGAAGFLCSAFQVQSVAQMVELAIASAQCECIFFCIYCWKGDIPV